MNFETALWILSALAWGVALFFFWRTLQINRARCALRGGRDDKLLRRFRSAKP